MQKCQLYASWIISAECFQFSLRNLGFSRAEALNARVFAMCDTASETIRWVKVSTLSLKVIFRESGLSLRDCPITAQVSGDEGAVPLVQTSWLLWLTEVTFARPLEAEPPLPDRQVPAEPATAAAAFFAFRFRLRLTAPLEVDSPPDEVSDRPGWLFLHFASAHFP